MRALSFALLALLALRIGPAMAGFANANEDDAARQVEQGLSLTPNLENGRRVYLMCAVCHLPEGWGSEDGYYPQIAGQHASVTIKQLADIRARNRDVPTMLPFTMVQNLTVQDMTDVAAYIQQLPMAPYNDVGPGVHLAHGKRLYEEHCADCHGYQGEGNAAKNMPLIQGQHYSYLVRQYRWIKYGKRRNADAEMTEQAQTFTGRDISAVMDYTSRLRPPAEKTAQPGWQNGDFSNFVRTPLPETE